MVSPGWAWTLPIAGAMLLVTLWRGWQGRRAAGLLCVALLSLWLPTPLAAAAAVAALLLAPGAQRWDAPLMASMAALLRLRLQWLPQFPGSMGTWVGIAALVLVIAASQQLLAAESGEEASAALARGQAAWLLFGFLSPAPLGWSGALLILWQQGLVRQPLAVALEESPGRIVLVGLLFLALAGGPPFGVFNAYFQVLAPLMTVGAAVTSMQAKLFSGTGLLAVLAILALLYQTGSFGYFYWSRVLPAAPAPGAPSEGWRPVPQPWAWTCVFLGIAWGVAEHFGGPGRLAAHALQALGAIPNS